MHSRDFYLKFPCTPNKGCGILESGRDVGVSYCLEEMKNLLSFLKFNIIMHWFDNKININLVHVLIFVHFRFFD